MNSTGAVLDVTLRPARPEDAELVVARTRANEAQFMDFRPKKLTKACESGQGIVAFSGGLMVGAAFSDQIECELQNSKRTTEANYVHNLWLLPELQGRHRLAPIILEATIGLRYATSDGVLPPTVSGTCHKNVAAQKAFQKAGFAVFDPRTELSTDPHLCAAHAHLQSLARQRNMTCPIAIMAFGQRSLPRIARFLSVASTRPVFLALDRTRVFFHDPNEHVSGVRGALVELARELPSAMKRLNLAEGSHEQTVFQTRRVG